MVQTLSAPRNNRSATPLLVLLLACVALIATACSSDVVTPVATASTDESASTDGAADESEEATESDVMESDAFPVTLTTASGDVEIPAMPEQIISLSPSATEMLFAVGAGDQVVAVDEYSNYPAEAPTSELSGYTPNIEAISSYGPDLVIAAGPIEGIDVLGAPMLILGAATNLDDVYTQIEQLGAATGHVGEAAAVVGNMQTEVEAIQASLPELDEPLTYFHELGTEFYTATSSTFIGSVYDMVGLENIADPADADGSSFGYPQLTEEAIIDADPDLIFLADTIGYGMTAEAVGERPGWGEMAAVQNGNVIELNDDVASRWGPRITELLATVAEAIKNVNVPVAN